MVAHVISLADLTQFSAGDLATTPATKKLLFAKK